MEKDILKEIVDRRLDDISRLGVDFGSGVPAERNRKIHPFIQEPGAILEIKRASPSKGGIAPDLDAAKTAIAYSKAGARAISCLTETNYFKGSLTDLMAAAKALDEFERECDDSIGSADEKKNETSDFEENVDCGISGARVKLPALLRKDFLLSAEEVNVSYRAGADAVLLIARILPKETLLEMAECAERLGISVLIEVRKNDDLEKLSYVMKYVNHKYIVCGVNSRDLKDFSIDMLAPVEMLSEIKKIAADARVVFESGILSPESAAFAGSLGFSAILLGEAAAKNPAHAGSFALAFKKSADALLCGQTGRAANNVAAGTVSAETGIKACGRAADNQSSGHFWLDYAARLHSQKACKTLPFVKICGLTRKEDALLAAQLGADFLGFIFWKGSRRNVDGEKVRQISTAVRESGYSGKLVGVIVEPDGAEATEAFSLVQEGVLDVIQFHNCTLPLLNSSDNSIFAGKSGSKSSANAMACANIPRYAAVSISSQKDLEKLDELIFCGEPRVLIDALANGQIGGTGTVIAGELVEQAAKKVRLWLAGGITAENAGDIIERFTPELIDIASGVEKEPGIKDEEKMKALFSVIRGCNKKNV